MTPLVAPVRVCVLLFITPVTDRLVPVAAPMTGVTKVGVLLKTTLPLPVLVVVPVPPFTTGSAVPDNVTANVPEDVIGLPDTVKNDGTESATLVTVPVVTVVQVIAVAPPPCEVKT
jgi:hypothetical protein